MKPTAVFLDTAFILALSIKTDVCHHPALTIATQLKRDATPIITTRAIMVEIGNSLSKLRYRQIAKPFNCFVHGLTKNGDWLIVSLLWLCKNAV